MFLGWRYAAIRGLIRIHRMLNVSSAINPHLIRMNRIVFDRKYICVFNCGECGYNYGYYGYLRVELRWLRNRCGSYGVLAVNTVHLRCLRKNYGDYGLR